MNWKKMMMSFLRKSAEFALLVAIVLLMVELDLRRGQLLLLAAVLLVILVLAIKFDRN